MAILRIEVKDELVDDIAEGLEYSTSGGAQAKGAFVTQQLIKLIKSYAQRGRRTKANAAIESSETPIADADIK